MSQKLEGNISQCKEVVTTGEVRHLEGVKGNFAVSDTEYIDISCAAITASSATTPNSTKSQPTTTGTTVPHAVYVEDVQQQQYVFEILRNKGIPAEQNIREIDEGVIPVRTRLLENLCFSQPRLAMGIAKFINKLNANFLTKQFIDIVINHSHSNDLVLARPSENHSVDSYVPKKYELIFHYGLLYPSTAASDSKDFHRRKLGA